MKKNGWVGRLSLLSAGILAAAVGFLSGCDAGGCARQDKSRVMVRPTPAAIAVAPGVEALDAALWQAALTGVRGVLKMPDTAEFAAANDPASRIEAVDRTHVRVTGRLTASDATRRRRNLRFSVLVEFSEGVFYRAELPELTEEQ